MAYEGKERSECVTVGQNCPHAEKTLIIPHEFEAMIERAAEHGAERVLTHLGLENGHAARDIRELRDLLEAWRDARHIAWQTIVRIITTGILAALLVGVAIKLKLMGGSQ